MSYGSFDGRGDLVTVVISGVWCFYHYTYSALFDSTSAISIARDLVKHELTKHIGVDASFVRAGLQDLVIALQYVPSELQLVDFFTKAQTKAKHGFYLSKLVVDPP